ncbi:MAG: hypothetical protein CMI31_12960 [Opitutae bacterium]|nr:hypothetical protein [Opitutae bacterium]
MILVIVIIQLVGMQKKHEIDFQKLLVNMEINVLQYAVSIIMIKIRKGLNQYQYLHWLYHHYLLLNLLIYH